MLLRHRTVLSCAWEIKSPAAIIAEHWLSRDGELLVLVSVLEPRSPAEPGKGVESPFSVPTSCFSANDAAAFTSCLFLKCL